MDVLLCCSGLIYGFLSCLYIFFFMENNKKTCLKPLVKVLPLITMALTIMIIFSNSDSRVYYTVQPGKLNRILYVLLFSMIGDVYLVYSSLFTYGLLSFNIAQGFMIFLFSDEYELYYDIIPSGLMSLAIVSIISIALLLYFIPKMECITALPASIYCFFITIILWSAILQLQKNCSPVSIGGVAGVAMLYVSNLLLAMNKWRKPFPRANTIIMALYYASHIIIIFSTILS